MEQEIEEVAGALKVPAGNSNLFANRTAILNNHAAFVRVSSPH
jgi:hypothetical protein